MTLGALIGLSCVIGVLHGEVLGVASEPTGDHRAWQRQLDRGAFGAALRHAVDQPDAEDLVIERARARRLDTRRAPLLHEADNA